MSPRRTSAPLLVALVTGYAMAPAAEVRAVPAAAETASGRVPLLPRRCLSPGRKARWWPFSGSRS